MGYAGEAIDGGGFKGAVDEEGIMVADECWEMLVFISQLLNMTVPHTK